MNYISIYRLQGYQNLLGIKVTPSSDSVTLRQLNPNHKNGSQSFYIYKICKRQ